MQKFSPLGHCVSFIGQKIFLIWRTHKGGAFLLQIKTFLFYHSGSGSKSAIKHTTPPLRLLTLIPTPQPWLELFSKTANKVT